MKKYDKIAIDETGALISHYVHNRNSKFETPFLSAIPYLYEDPYKEGIGGIVAEPIVPQDKEDAERSPFSFACLPLIVKISPEFAVQPFKTIV